METTLIQTARDAIEEQIRAYMKSRPVCLLFQEHRVTFSANKRDFPALTANQAYFTEKYPQYSITWQEDDSLADGAFSCSIE